jgi:hypothetical protein
MITLEFPEWVAWMFASLWVVSAILTGVRIELARRLSREEKKTQELFKAAGRL